MNHFTDNESELIRWITKHYSIYYRIWNTGLWSMRTDTIDAYFWVWK